MESTSSPRPFDNLPIDRAKNEFRLWKFGQGCTAEDLVLHLEVFSMDQSPPYIALSYTWSVCENSSRSHSTHSDRGSKDDIKPINVNNASVSVTKNLWEFLLVLLEKHRDGWFWADQISIDQNDVNERGHQVSLMGAVFFGAEEVFAYLGPMPDVPESKWEDLPLVEYQDMNTSLTEYIA